MIIIIIIIIIAIIILITITIIINIIIILITIIVIHSCVSEGYGSQLFWDVVLEPWALASHPKSQRWEHPYPHAPKGIP